jgi:hypothetical protein
MKGGKGNWTVLRKCGHLTQPQDLERYQRNEEWSVLHPTMQTVRAGELKDWDLSPGVQNPTAERSVRFYNAPLVLNEGLGCRQHLRAVCRGAGLHSTSCKKASAYCAVRANERVSVLVSVAL